MKIAAHNAKFDYTLTRSRGIPPWKAKIWDTMIAAWLLDSERPSISLSSLSADILSLRGLEYAEIVPKQSKDADKEGTFAEVPLSTATQYAGEDADFCLRLMKVLDKALVDYGQKELFETVEMPLVAILAEMELAGIHLDGKTLDEYSLELAEKLEEIEGEIYSLVGHRFNIASTKQLQEVLFTERGLKPGKKTKTGFSTDVAVLEELSVTEPFQN
jgi:DNA polymerase-1